VALIYNRFPTYGLFAAYPYAARLWAYLTEVAGRRSERCSLTSTDDLRANERRPRTSRQLPGSVFDARYEGLTGYAALACRGRG